MFVVVCAEGQGLAGFAVRCACSDADGLAEVDVVVDVEGCQVGPAEGIVCATGSLGMFAAVLADDFSDGPLDVRVVVAGGDEVDAA